LLAAAIGVFAPLAATADAIDLSSWSDNDLNFVGGQGPSNWTPSSGNTVVTQVNNAAPSMYLNNLNQTSYEIDGSWQVLSDPTGDNDFIRFVFGYQNSSNFYLFDWKHWHSSALAY
jgi:hypothetical protein